MRDPNSDACAVIDSVLDLDYASGTIGYIHADMIIDFIETHQLSLEWLIETHVHADHLSAAPYIQQKLGGKIGIAEQIVEVQQVFGKMFNAGTEFQRDGSQFDFLFNEGSQYAIGGMSVSVMHTPGHTPACMTHVIGDAAFVVIRCLCLTAGPPELIFLVVMLPSFIISIRILYFPRRPAFLSAMITSQWPRCCLADHRW